VWVEKIVTLVPGLMGGTSPGQTRKTPKDLSVMLCTCVRKEGWDGEGVVSEVSSLSSYTLRYVSLTETDTVCQFGLREPIHLCTYVNEEGGDGEGVS
jgi:hypothetical protein